MLEDCDSGVVMIQVRGPNLALISPVSVVQPPGGCFGDDASAAIASARRRIMLG
jgi:hypothetical protein